jgi:hypothetical protein
MMEPIMAAGEIMKKSSQQRKKQLKLCMAQR